MSINLAEVFNSRYLPLVIVGLLMLVPTLLGATKIIVRKFRRRFRPDLRNLFLHRHRKNQADKKVRLKERKLAAKQLAEVPMMRLTGVQCEVCGVPMKQTGLCQRCDKAPLAHADLVRMACRYDTVAKVNMRRKKGKVTEQIAEFLFYTAEEHGLTVYDTITFIPASTQSDDAVGVDQNLAGKLARRLNRRAASLLVWDEAKEEWQCNKKLAGKRILVVGGFTAPDFIALEIVARVFKASGARQVAGLFVARRDR